MPRRGENIYKRKDGRWEARYIKGHALDGRIIYGYLYARSYADIKKAQTEAKQLNKNLEIAKSLNKHTLENHLEFWLESVKMSVRKSTYANYKNIIHHYIIPSIGNKPLNQISNETIQPFINNKLQSGKMDGTGGLSVKTVKDILSILKLSLKTTGIELNIKMPKYSLPKLRVLTPEEQALLVTTAIKEKEQGLGILLSLYTGIRIGELCSLRWTDISLTEGVLKVNKTIQRIKDSEEGDSKTVIYIGRPKSECSIRVVPLPDFLLCILSDLKKESSGDSYILSGNSKYIEPRLYQYKFKKILKKAGVADINFHALRHTFATRCVELGIDVKTISDLLGHATVNMTLNRYVHPAFDHQKNCIEKLSSAF